ncbi:aminotransferase class I/II-fold pyridoxal phosphate-dependent enzyme [Acetobacteraceae bacterium KSS8]|uniref:8-amino-7-oxononanoate synthase n=2 Tax=Endosaccharibacter trunci TaxID=2812733 RepID=A0ABT1W352_9PROT|nr:aminotransferase class I/II-fold pyridoxal phosphate-dependent enzyme [Acetobacteraceae bacterium KSS8]
MRRHIAPVSPAPGIVLRDGQTLINASGNDYLGLVHRPELAERAADWAARFGTGAGASRLVTGSFELHRQVERKIARFKNTEAALLFASGWQLNAAVLPILLAACAPARPVLFTDRLIHASLHHGILASGLRQNRFRHNDLDHLEELLDRAASEPGPRFIVTESVFSMDGDRADLVRLRRIADRHDAFLYVDEAHATGVLGPGGAGLSGEAGGVDLVMGTLSKAFGGFGAYVAGSQVLCDWLLNACSGFVHTTALPPPVLGAVDAALDLMPTLDADRARLQSNAAMLRDRLGRAGIDTGASSTQIVPMMIGAAEDALRVADAMREQGVLGIAIRPPTVPLRGSRIRLALSAAHSDAQCEAIAQAAITAWQSR